MSDQIELLIARLIETVVRLEVSILQRLTELETNLMSDFTKLQAAEDDVGAKIAALTAREDTVSALVDDLNTKLAALQAAQANGDQASIDALTAEVVSHGQNIQAELDKPLPTEGGASTVSGGSSTVSGGTDTTGGAGSTPPSGTGTDTTGGAASGTDSTTGASS